ncbi:antibiotic biosynthesis monooxygenase [Streptomyces sp. B21-083]|uniref:antibiotic biosynthesis monooxygenase n=1 Tax=Streptomyces sp. B21-083 TaxID=3039410 RepID=UPI002FF16208
MTRRTETPPDLTDPRVGAPFFSHWRVHTPLRQRQTVEAIADTWQRRPWPAAGLIGYHVYTGHDGEALMHYSQWATEQAYEAFVKTRRQERNDEIDLLVPDIERLGLDRYRRYRSSVRDGDTRVPGCVVVVDVEFVGPDPDRQRAWADAALEALENEPDAHPGGISAHFHLSTDGSRVLNYAEWESAQAHVDALATWPGLKSATVSRYDHALGLVP